MGLADDNYPSSALFDTIKSTLESDEKLRKQSIKKSDAIVVFKLKNKQGQTQQWYLDLKKDGTVGKGDPPAKADVTLALSDEHFAQLAAGKANAQKLFMSGKLKISGNLMKSQTIQGVLESSRNKAKL